MSFILDALKKSETDRQRQTGPALFEVKVAQPKAGFPVWAIAIVALLAINMVIVGWLLLRRTSRSDESAGQNTPPPAASQPALTQGSNSGTWSPSVSTLPPPPNAQQAYSPPVAQQNQSQANMARDESNDQSSARMGDRDPREPTLGGNAGAGRGGGALGANGTGGGPNGDGTFGANGTGGGPNGGGTFGANGTGGGPNGGGTLGANGTGGGPNGGGTFGANGTGGGPNGGGAFGANGAGGTGSGAMGGGAGSRGPGASGAHATGTTAANGDPGAEANSGNPDDYAPAQDPGSPLFKGHVRRGTESGYMLYQDLAVTNGANLPELRLDMHVYDPKPQNRFALINMRKMREGESIQDVRVEAITPDGVVMSHNGTKFLLPRE